MEGIFPGGRIHELGSGFRGSGSYLDLLRPVIALHTVIALLPISCYIPWRSLYYALYCSRRSLPISQRILSFITALRLHRWRCSSVLGIEVKFGIVGGEGYIRVLAATAPEPSVVNHWSTHHRKEGRIHDTQYYLGSTHLVWHNANKGYGESSTMAWLDGWVQIDVQQMVQLPALWLKQKWRLSLILATFSTNLYLEIKLHPIYILK